MQNQLTCTLYQRLRDEIYSYRAKRTNKYQSIMKNIASVVKVKERREGDCRNPIFINNRTERKVHRF